MDTQINDFLGKIMREIVSQHCNLPLLSAEWVGMEALRQLRNSKERRWALKEGATALARTAIMNDYAVQRHPVVRGEEIQYVEVDHFSNGEMLDLITRLRAEAQWIIERADILEHWLHTRMTEDPV